MKTLGVFAAAILALSALAMSSGCARNPVTGKKELVLISPQEEVRMGIQSAPQFEKEFGGKAPDPALQSYVSGVGMKVAAVSPRKGMQYEFAVLRSDVANAFALPGGKIYVTAGLMKHMTDERQLAAVLAHEVTHVAARHSVSQIQRSLEAEVLATLAGVAVGGEAAGTAEAVAKFVGTMANLKYSRDDEYQADKYGISYMAKAGYNPWGMVELLTVLKGISDKEPGKLVEMFQTHPLTSERITKARDEVRKKHPDADANAPCPKAKEFLALRDRMVKELRLKP